MMLQLYDAGLLPELLNAVAEQAIDATGRSRQAVYDAIEALEAEGIVAEISDSERYRVYEAPEILGVVASS